MNMDRIKREKERKREREKERKREREKERKREREREREREPRMNADERGYYCPLLKHVSACSLSTTHYPPSTYDIMIAVSHGRDSE